MLLYSNYELRMEAVSRETKEPVFVGGGKSDTAHVKHRLTLLLDWPYLNISLTAFFYTGCFLRYSLVFMMNRTRRLSISPLSGSMATGLITNKQWLTYFATVGIVKS